MGLLPKQYAARIAFFKNRLANWLSEATNIGTTTAAVTALQTAVTGAENALAEQEGAKAAAKTATLKLRQALTAMDNLGMGIVEQVRTKSRTAGEGVYVLADLPAPATPQPKSPPGQPYKLTVVVEQDGSLSLGWKCDTAGASGTTYQVYRSNTGSTGAFEFLGGSGERKFVDATIPAGTTAVTYKIRGLRSTAAGPWNTFNVTFGAAGGGGAVTALVEPAPKLAA